MKHIERYGALWLDTATDLDIEIGAIRLGGQWTSPKGKPCGNGLFFHYKRLQQLLWPEEDDHRWSDLILKEILANTVTVLAGCKDSGKTRGMAKYGLTDYFCFPHNTLIVVSSTTIQSLEGRVWGDLKSLWRRAKERFPWENDGKPVIPGVVLDNKHAIATDNLDDESVLVRDMRKGIMCFVAGSMVDTPTGPKPIEQLSVGDEVFNAVGVGRVKKTFQRSVHRLLRVTLSDGRILDCTEEHPILTDGGWTKAACLRTYDRVYCAYETMSIMRAANRKGLSKQKVLQQGVSVVLAAKEMRAMRERFQALESKSTQGTHRKILQPGLCKPMGGTAQRISSQSYEGMSLLWDNDERCSPKSRLLLSKLPKPSIHSEVQRMRKILRLGAGIPDAETDRFLRCILQKEMEQSINRGKSFRTNATRAFSQGSIPGSHFALPNQYRQEDDKKGTSLRTRFSVSRSKASSRDRRGNSSHSSEAGERQGKNPVVEPTWVVSIEVLESRSNKRRNQSSQSYSVHNLEIEGHPSYSVNGVIVHNCVPCKLSGGSENNISTYVGIKQERRRYLADEFSWMSNAMFNSLGNVNAGNFKMVCAGNPIGQDDPLDKISEPEGGWDSVGIPEKTTVWKNRLFLDSKTVCLIGTDSPNFDYPQDQPPKFWYMVNKDSIARVVAGYGKDSSQYWSQCVGMRRAGMMSKRVITAQICRQHRAFDDVIWEGSKPTTKIAGLDAAYGGVGGDRCVLIVGEFGLDNEGKTLLLVHAPMIVPVSVKLDKKPEDQIARWCMDYCVSLSIPPANFFYDSTGRGLLHAAFTKVWSSEVEGVEFGGAPSSRIVSADLFVTDMKTLRNRPLLCNEHYMNFVTELWFSVRYAIESEQIRGLPNDVAEEGYARMYYEVKAKVQVERKSNPDPNGQPGMKERVGWSPDKFDALVAMVEGARRRGFVISRLGGAAASKNSQDWLRKWQEEHKAAERKHELIYD